MSIVRDEVQPYKPLRVNLLRRDRSFCERVVTPESVASFVSDGASVGIAHEFVPPMKTKYQVVRAMVSHLS